jgi:hypothetical protein
MSDKGAVEGMINTLRQHRDQLALKMHLAKMESKDEYDRLSTKVDELSDQFEPVKEATSEVAGKVFSALALAAGEVQKGFERVRDAVSGSDKKQNEKSE